MGDPSRRVNPPSKRVLDVGARIGVGDKDSSDII